METIGNVGARVYRDLGAWGFGVVFVDGDWDLVGFRVY